MKRQFHFPRYNTYSSTDKKTARLTNSINAVALNSFNKWGGLSYEDILSNYPKDIIENCWINFTMFIIENYLSGKGTFIKGFGTFTFTNVECNLEGTTNQYERDIKKRRPIFLVSNEFIDYLRPGIFTEKSGLIYYKQKLNNSVPIVKVNYAKISYGVNISKEECFTILSNTIKLMGDQIRRNVFIEKIMPNLGIFLSKKDVFGMKFDYSIYEISSIKTQKLILLKKNLRFYMETKDSEGVSHKDIDDIDKAERNIRPKTAVITKVTKSGAKWLQKNMNINVEYDILDSPREDLYFTKAKNKKEYYVDQRYYRSYPKQNLYGLEISQDILESIYNNKSLLIRDMKLIDRHGDGLIPKYDFINCFFKANCHHNLRIELIEKITNVYINNDPNIIMIQYVNLINNLCKDIKDLVDIEYTNFPIEKYKHTINKKHKRAVSAYAYSRDSGNLESSAISSLKRYNNLTKVNENEVKKDILKINKVIYFIKNKNKMISYLALISTLQSHMLSFNKTQMIKILRFLEIKNPNAFTINDLIVKLNKYTMNSTSINFRPKSSVAFNNRYNNNILRTTSNIKVSSYNSKSQRNNYFEPDTKYNFTDNSQNFNHNNRNTEFDIKACKLIRDRIYSYGSEIDEISKYFDHLLSYNICRSENIIYPDEFERLLKLEKYDFTLQEAKNIFSYIDTKGEGFIDRIGFIKAMKSIPHPITTILNYIRNNKLTIEDIAYKMGYDFYNCNLEYILNDKLDRLKFFLKIKSINDKFDRDFINDLFYSLIIDKSANNQIVTVKKLFDIFNINHDDSYLKLSDNKKNIHELCMNTIPKYITLKEAKNKFLSLDTKITGKVPYDTFMNQMRIFLKGKISDKNLTQFLRANKFIDEKNYVDYHNFLILIFIDIRDDAWKKCLDELQKFLRTECNNDLFIFVVKLNNLDNNSTFKKTISSDRLYEFFRGKVNMLERSMIMRFDYDKDGIISMDDIKNTILECIDSHYFDNKKIINENLKMKSDRNRYEENKKIYLNIKEALYKINMTEDNLFKYLDSNKDGYIDINEFNEQLSKLPLTEQYTKKQFDLFYSYFDEYNNGKIDLNTFKSKIRLFKDDMREHNENGYIGNSTIENLILTEFAKWFSKNSNLCDTEIFSILDNDHDGQISVNDMKLFAIRTLLMPSHELDDNKIMRFIESVSLTHNNNLVLADIQNLMQCMLSNNIEEFRLNIYNFCNKGVNENNKDENWINNVMKKIGMFINENYQGNIKQFYDDYNLTNFINQGKGLSFDNFQIFFENNCELFQSYHIEKDQQKVLFNYISNKEKFITLEDLKKLFGNTIENGEENYNYDYYNQMHNDIIIFLHENFPKCEDAFKYFHSVNSCQSEVPTFDDKNSEKNYITKKEFFEGISKLFPDIYQTNTISNYYNKFFKKDLPENEENSNIIKYSEFNFIYYGQYTFDEQFNNTLKNDSKILTTRPDVSGIPFTTLNSPFPVKEHKKLETPYDLDPLEKIKRLILSSKPDFNVLFKKCIEESGNGMANQFEFRNIIKKLDLGLTNIEIEDIINKSCINSDGNVNLVDFYKYITGENKNLKISKENILEILKELKQLIYKYYSNPRLAFELNDSEVKGTIDFDKFKKIVYDVYKRESKQTPTYSVMKYVYDYIDIRKDGVIDLNEWSKIFAQAEGKLDIERVFNNQMKNLREWETSKDISKVYNLIAKNKKIIKDKVKLFCGSLDILLIHSNNLIDILKNVFGKVNLSQTQWKMIVSVGKKDKTDLIDFDAFIKVIDAKFKKEKSHPIK